jgi:integrase
LDFFEPVFKKLIRRHPENTIQDGITMEEFDLVESWLTSVRFSHSGSPTTEKMYRVNFRKFLNFIQKTPQQIFEDYQSYDERRFKIIYAQYVKSLIGELQKRGYAPGTVTATVDVIKSFFKHTDLPLGYIPSGSTLVQFHNKDISRTEILEILKIASPRDRAFFTLIAQSGLRPSTVASLKLRDIEGILTENTPVPCLITVRQENTKGKYCEYFSFVGKESIVNLKNYLKTREKDLTLDDYAFIKFGHEDEPLSPGVESHIFKKLVKKLREKNILDFKTVTKSIAVKDKKDRTLRNYISRSELRLYNLRKFFRKYAGQAGADFTNFWMGHLSVCGVDLHYFSRDKELHRQKYRELAMPFLRLQTETPTESQKAIEELQRQLAQKDEAIEELKAKVAEFSPEKIETIATTIFQKSWQDLVMKTLGTSAEEFKKQIKKEKEKAERPQSSEETTKPKVKAD